MDNARVLLVEDDVELAAVLEARLRYAPQRYDVAIAASGARALEQLHGQRVDCVLLDHVLPDVKGLTLLGGIRDIDASIPVIMITAAGSEELAVQALKQGAVDYIPKRSRNLLRIADAVEAALKQRPAGMRTAASARSNRAQGPAPLLGTSSAMQTARGLIQQAASSEVPVLIQGETGTGKELVAAHVHARGARADRPFVTVNCAAIPETLFESEVFGHERGAFTGADRRRAGVFERAHGGTLFLDEIGELTITCQAKLLRVLEDGYVHRLGASERLAADARIVVATNRDILEDVRKGTFRRDLYYRLRVLEIRIPPLRDRREDIEALATHFLRLAVSAEGKPIAGFEPLAMERLMAWPWPGNVRELQNEIRRLVLATPSGASIVTALPCQAGDPSVAPPVSIDETDTRPLRDIVRDVERATIVARLARYDFHRAHAAASLGMARESLWAKLRSLGVTIPRGRFDGEPPR